MNSKIFAFGSRVANIVAVAGAIAMTAGAGQAAKAATDAGFVNNVFRTLLIRPATAAEITHYTLLMSHGTTRFRVIGDIQRLSGHRAQQARRAYTTFLLRQPTIAERNIAAHFLTAGGTVEHLNANIIGSKEYFVNRGLGTNAGFLDVLFHDVVNRAPTAGELSMGLDMLSHHVSRTMIARNLLNTTEAYEFEVSEYFHKCIHRAGTPAEIADQVALLVGGAREEVVIANIMSTDEFYFLNN